jgi:hypothetical protein
MTGGPQRGQLPPCNRRSCSAAAIPRATSTDTASKMRAAMASASPRKSSAGADGIQAGRAAGALRPWSPAEVRMQVPFDMHQLTSATISMTTGVTSPSTISGGPSNMRRSLPPTLASMMLRSSSCPALPIRCQPGARGSPKPLPSRPTRDNRRRSSAGPDPGGAQATAGGARRRSGFDAHRYGELRNTLLPPEVGPDRLVQKIAAFRSEVENPLPFSPLRELARPRHVSAPTTAPIKRQPHRQPVV